MMCRVPLTKHQRARLAARATRYDQCLECKIRRKAGTKWPRFPLPQMCYRCFFDLLNKRRIEIPNTHDPRPARHFMEMVYGYRRNEKAGKRNSFIDNTVEDQRRESTAALATPDRPNLAKALWSWLERLFTSRGR